MATSPADLPAEVIVGALLAAASLRPTDAEMQAFVAGYPELVGQIERLYQVPVGDAPPLFALPPMGPS